MALLYSFRRELQIRQGGITIQWSRLAKMRLRQTNMQSRHQREEPEVQGVVESARGSMQARQDLKRTIIKRPEELWTNWNL
jgi:hypothetical protein